MKPPVPYGPSRYNAVSAAWHGVEPWELGEVLAPPVIDLDRPEPRLLFAAKSLRAFVSPQLGCSAQWEGASPAAQRSQLEQAAVVTEALGLWDWSMAVLGVEPEVVVPDMRLRGRAKELKRRMAAGRGS